MTRRTIFNHLILGPLAASGVLRILPAKATGSLPAGWPKTMYIGYGGRRKVDQKLIIGPALYSALLWGYRDDLKVYYSPADGMNDGFPDTYFAGMLGYAPGHDAGKPKRIQLWVDTLDKTTLDDPMYSFRLTSEFSEYFAHCVFVKNSGHHITSPRQLVSGNSYRSECAKNFFDYIDKLLVAS